MKFDKLLELHSDDLVYRTITAFEAPSAVVSSEFDGAFVTPQTFPTYAINREQLLPGYMALLTTAPEFHEAMSTRCVGSVLRRKTLSQSAFESIPLALPPLDEQRRIVDLIAAVDNAVDAAEGEAAAARELSDAARRVLFENAEGERDRLGEVVTFAGGYAFPPSEQGRTEGDVPFIKVSDMNLPGNERGIRSAVNWVTGDVKSQLRAKAWPEGTVVFPKVGAALLSEKRRFLTRPTIFDNNVMGLVAGPRLDSAYLLAFMEGVRLSELAQHGAVPSVNQSHLTSMEIPVPPLSAQHRIVRQYEAVLDAADAARATAESLRTLRSNLLTVLLSGEHEIPSSYDALLGEVA